MLKNVTPFALGYQDGMDLVVTSQKTLYAVATFYDEISISSIGFAIPPQVSVVIESWIVCLVQVFNLVQGVCLAVGKPGKPTFEVKKLHSNAKFEQHGRKQVLGLNIQVAVMFSLVSFLVGQCD